MPPRRSRALFLEANSLGASLSGSKTLHPAAYNPREPFAPEAWSTLGAFDWAHWSTQSAEVSGSRLTALGLPRSAVSRLDPPVAQTASTNFWLSRVTRASPQDLATPPLQRVSDDTLLSDHEAPARCSVEHHGATLQSPSIQSSPSAGESPRRRLGILQIGQPVRSARRATPVSKSRERIANDQRPASPLRSNAGPTSLVRGGPPQREG